MANDFLQGVQVGAGLLETNARLQQLRSQRAMQMAQERQAAQLMAMKVAEFDQQVQYRADMTKAMGMFQMATAKEIPVPVGVQNGMPVMGAMPNPQPMNQTQAALQFIIPVIGAHEPQKVPQAMQDIAMAEYRQQASAFQPGIQVLHDPNTGKNVSVLTTGRNSVQRIPESAMARQEQNFKNQKARDVFKFALDNAPDLMTEGPDGMPALKPGAFDEAARRASLATSTKGALEQSQISSENLFDTGRKLLPLINERTVGVKGELQRLARRTGISMVFPELSSAESAEAETVGQQFTSSVIRSLKSDGNINKDEVARLERAANTINWTNPRDAKSRLATLVEDGARLSRNAAIRLSKPISDRFLTWDEIKARAEARAAAGEMTPDQAIEWGLKIYENSAQGFVDQIRSEIGQQ